MFSYDDQIAAIAATVKMIAPHSIVTAVEETKPRLTCDDIDISVDGTWQKHGYTSKNRVVTWLRNGGKHEVRKVVNVEVLTI